MTDVGLAVDLAAKSFQKRVTIGREVVNQKNKVNVKTLNEEVATLIAKVADDLERRINETLTKVLDPIKKNLESRIVKVSDGIEPAIQAAIADVSEQFNGDLQQIRNTDAVNKQAHADLSSRVLMVSDEAKKRQQAFSEQFAADLKQLETRVDEKMDAKRKQAEHTAQVAVDDAREKAMALVDDAKKLLNSNIASSAAAHAQEHQRIEEAWRQTVEKLQKDTCSSEAVAQTRLDEANQIFHKEIKDLDRKFGEQQNSLSNEMHHDLDAMARDLQIIESYWCHTFVWHPDPVASEEAENTVTDSVLFDAAGYRDLRLNLTAERVDKNAIRKDNTARVEKAAKFACSVFITDASSCRVRITLNNTHTATFKGEPWGGRIGSPIDLEGLVVSVEFLEWQPPFTSMQTPNNCRLNTRTLNLATHVASEIATMRNRMVRRVDWVLIDVATHLQEQVTSPAFSAGGIDNLQLYFYPNGYRTKQDGYCGFFVHAPVGVYLKCRAYVGPVEKTFEHKFESAMPFGRGCYCRFAKAMSAGGPDLRCGIDIMEIYQDWTKSTRHHGNCSVLKIQSATAGMEDALEIRGTGKPLPSKLQQVQLLLRNKTAQSVPELGTGLSPTAIQAFPRPLMDKDHDDSDVSVNAPQRERSQGELPRIR